ncbi:MAG: lycopene cyclase domain-containing protein [Gammaproteobacteria bacterium]
MQNVWLIWSLGYLLIWTILFIVKKDFRREMFWVSLLTMPLGLTEPLFVPSYWDPPSLFNLADKTGFDIESLIFSFAVGGIGSVLYNILFEVYNEPLLEPQLKQKRHKWHGFILLMPVLVFISLALFTTLNHIYCAIIAMSLSAIATIYCRPDLITKILIGGLLFLFLYFVFFTIIIWVFPDFVQQSWNLKALSGILIFNIPLEELLFAYAFGMLWSSLYEHYFWLKVKN